MAIRCAIRCVGVGVAFVRNKKEKEYITAGSISGRQRASWTVSVPVFLPTSTSKCAGTKIKSHYMPWHWDFLLCFCLFYLVLRFLLCLWVCWLRFIFGFWCNCRILRSITPTSTSARWSVDARFAVCRLVARARRSFQSRPRVFCFGFGCAGDFGCCYGSFTDFRWSPPGRA